MCVCVCVGGACMLLCVWYTEVTCIPFQDHRTSGSGEDFERF